MWYDVGTISVTNGSTTVTGSGTDFISGVQVGEGLYIGGDLYEIAVVNSSTQLTLADAYLGSTATGQDYKIIPTQSLVADLSSGVADLISDFADVRDYAGNGKFDDGTVTQPAITFTQDQNNGLYRIGSDNWGLVAGGEKIVDISTTGIDVTGTVQADGLTVDGDTFDLKLQPELTSLPADDENSYIFTTSGSGSGFFSRFGALGLSSRNRDTGSSDIGFFTDKKLGMLIQDTGNIQFYENTGTTPKMTWDSSAEILRITGDGTSLSLLGATQNIAGGNSNLKIGSSDAAAADKGGQLNFTANTVSLANYPVAGVHGYHETVGAGNYSGYLSMYTTSSGGSVTERMRIDSTGNVGIGTASPSAKLDVVGDIKLSGGVITSSDYRLKEDIQPMQSYADTVKQMNLVNFAWKESGEREDGFIAHELQALVPSAVRGDKDAVNEDGEAQYQGVDPLKLIPVLTKALQEALERIEILENN
jgi:hypothetical protein